MAEETSTTAEFAFPKPTTSVEAERYKQVQVAVRDALQTILSSATEAGWGTQEVIVAILEAGHFLKDSHIADATRQPLL